MSSALPCAPFPAQEGAKEGHFQPVRQDRYKLERTDFFVALPDSGWVDDRLVASTGFDVALAAG
jgi:hypothetical protein